jgi:hypothetical protein
MLTLVTVAGAGDISDCPMDGRGESTWGGRITAVGRGRGRRSDCLRYRTERVALLANRRPDLAE